MTTDQNPAAATGELPARGYLPAVDVASALPTAASEPAADATDALLIPVFTGDGELEVPASDALPGALTESIYRSLRAVGASGAAEKVSVVPAPADAPVATLIAVGLGDAAQVDSETVRRAAGAASRAAHDVAKAQGAPLTVTTTLPEFGLAPAVEGVLLGGYRYAGIHTPANTGEDKEESAAKARFVFITEDTEDSRAEFEAARIAAEATAMARDLVNTPSNELYPETYAAFLKKEAEAVGIEVELLDEVELSRQGYGGILAVGRSSTRPPRLVRLKWAPDAPANSDTVALVGKGITFDTGGISLKPGSGMWDMVMDMGGSAAVAAAIIAAARLQLPVPITATLPLAENMPSGSATRPGDVITHYGGITSEILNTDAEGRVVLADAIARACEDDPTFLIDTATLTGAQMVALGDRTAGVMGTDEFRDQVAATGRSVGESAWAMPLLEEHEEDVKSAVADIRNINAKREGGMEYAATYLSRFVGDEVDWAHIDVAGPAWNGGGPRGYHPKRATGVPTRTILATLRKIADRDAAE